ncbi:MAG TPA: lysophospholipid acyltransferase family protein [Anaeromyxobacteraceae bacterium]|nr:lysophospholipid acyltransferase family protein [Anaeromyxobacteraceae bacterium]
MRLAVPVVAALAYTLSLIALAVWPPLTLLVLLVTRPFDPNRSIAGQFYRILPALWSRSFPFWRIRIEGRWPSGRGPYVVVANHQSFLDIFVLCNINMRHEWKWVAKRELFRIPMFGWGLSLAGDISLDRGDAASAIAAIDKARRYLKSGMSVMIFPEGTRSKDGKLLPFKTGAFKLAIETGVPVLPIAVSGSAHGMPRGGPWVRPTRITVQILEPVPTAGLGRRGVRTLSDTVRRRIARALEQSEPAAGLQEVVLETHR